MYSATSNYLKVTVEPEYNHDLSSPYDHYFVWEYTITIENTSSEIVQLISRHWQIISSNGKMKEVIGEGVVGKQPILSPGEKFQYTSATDLDTPNGIMKGTYKMVSNGKEFDILIPTFSLDKPGLVTQLN